MALNLQINWKRDRWALFYCLIATLGALCYGYCTQYYTGIQGMRTFIHDYGFKNPDGTHYLSTSFLSTTASLYFLGNFLGAFGTEPINNKFGRKAVFLSASCSLILGAIVLLCSFGSYAAFCIGQVLVGLGVGQFTTVCLIYIAEIAPSHIRGPILNGFQFMQSLSQFVAAAVTQGTHNISNTASYRIPMGLLLVLPLIMICCLPILPESPLWYVFKGRREDAVVSLRKIHRYDYDPADDLRAIDEQISLELQAKAESSWGSIFKNPAERRKLIFSCGAMFAQQINGIQFWYTYGVIFAQSLGVSNPFIINMITMVLQIIVVGAAVALVNKISRRMNLLVCTVGMFCSLLIVGGLGTTHLSNGVAIGIVVCAYVNIVCFNFSIGSLSYTIASEMAVGRNKARIMACSIGTFFFTVWLMVFVSPYLYYDAKLGPKLGFVYAGTSLFTLAYVWFCVGETTGRTNEEIDRLLIDKVPVRMWKDHKWSARRDSEMTLVGDEKSRKSSVVSV